MIHTNKKNIFSYCIVVLIILSLGQILLYWSTISLTGDDWSYLSSYSTTYIPYSLKSGLHPGRQIAEILTLSPDNNIIRFLGNNTNDLYFVITTVMALVCFFWTVLYCYISGKYYVENGNKLTFLFVLWTSVFVFDMYTTYTHNAFIISSNVLSLISWLPFLYFYRHNKIFQVFEHNKSLNWGFFLVIFYLGTAIHDTTNIYFFIMTSFLLLFIGYRILIEKTQSLSENKEIISLAVVYLLYIMFAVFRNTVRSNYQIEFRSPQFANSLLEILNRIFWYGNNAVILILSCLVCFTYLIVFIKKRKISPEHFLIFSGLASGLATRIITAFLNTTNSQGSGMTIVFLMSLFYQIQYKKILRSFISHAANVVLPSIFLLFFLLFLYFFKTASFPISQDSNRELIALFQEADKQNHDTIYLSDEKIQYFIGLDYSHYDEVSHQWPIRAIPTWMKYHGYTKTYIKIERIKQ